MMRFHQHLRKPFAIRQIAYVTDDMDAALTLFAERHGVAEILVLKSLEMPFGDGRTVILDIGAFHAGADMIEIIRPVGGDMRIYEHHLPRKGERMRFHHFGYFTNSVEQWRSIGDAIAAENIPVAGEMAMGTVRAIYTDHCAELGHYIEVGLMDAAGEAVLRSFPSY